MSAIIIEQMIGKVFSSVETQDNDCLVFSTNDGEKIGFYHRQDCCESVEIYDICGELEDLINSPITQAEEVSNAECDEPTSDESFTWTFYKFSTVKGSVTVRWLGESNGYYSESVDMFHHKDGVSIKINCGF